MVGQHRVVQNTTKPDRPDGPDSLLNVADSQIADVRLLSVTLMTKACSTYENSVQKVNMPQVEISSRNSRESWILHNTKQHKLMPGFGHKTVTDVHQLLKDDVFGPVDELCVVQSANASKAKLGDTGGGNSRTLSENVDDDFESSTSEDLGTGGDFSGDCDSLVGSDCISLNGLDSQHLKPRLDLYYKTYTMAQPSTDLATGSHVTLSRGVSWLQTVTMRRQLRRQATAPSCNTVLTMDPCTNTCLSNTLIRSLPNRYERTAPDQSMSSTSRYYGSGSGNSPVIRPGRSLQNGSPLPTTPSSLYRRRPRQRTRGDENTTQEFVTQLLQDAMESEVTSKVDGLMESSRSHVEYDRYGFAKQTTWEDEDSDLVARAKRMQKKCEEINKMMQDSDVEVTIRVKWDNYLIGLGSRELQPCPELKSLIRLGIPYQHKERVWKECIELRVGQLRKQHGHGYYMDLLSSRKRTGGYNPAAKQIELDLLRTLPNNRHYESLNGEGVPKLRRILLAYSAHNPLIGYCQGLNRLAGIALLFLNEEDAFWCLVAIVDYIMPQDYYSKTLMASQADQRVLKDLISEKLPRLSAHLEQYDVDPSMFTFNWFLTVFVDNIPVETFLRIWDVFLYEGTKVLFRFAIAFFKYAEDDILSLQDHMSIHKYLRFLGEIMADPRKLCQIAFHDLNPFPMRVITNKRQFYMGQVKAELEELDAIREDFKSCQIPSERREFYSDEDND